MKKLTLPSGRILEVGLSPWETGENLYQTIAGELLKMVSSAHQELDESFILKIGLLVVSSKEVKRDIWACTPKCLIDGERLTRDHFEDEAHRDDYLLAMKEIAMVNIMPFMKSLYAQYAPILEMLKKSALA